MSTVYQIQPPVPLQESLLWRIQQLSYDAQGMEAWAADKTPSYITSNPHFAASTARVILGMLVDIGEPVTIVELGAGTGRFSWLLLNALVEAVAACPVPVPDWMLVMTDSAASLVSAWQQHPQLRAHVGVGRLDFARFDATAPRAIRLREHRRLLAPGPRIVLANYLWDSLPQDAYEVGSGSVEALHIGLACDADPSDLDAPTLMSQLRLVQSRAEPPALTGPVAEKLTAYAGRLTRPTAALVPAAAMSCIDWLARQGPVAVLSADKGVAAPEHITDGEPLPVVIHGGSTSMSVDFTMLDDATKAAGGWSLTGSTDEPLFLHHLTVHGFSPDQLSRGAMAFQQAFSPGGGYARYTLCRATVAEEEPPSLDRLLALLSLTRWDPDILYTLSGAIHAHSEALTPAHRAALLSALRRVGRNTFAAAGDDDVDRLIARLCDALSDPAGAEGAWERHILHRGESVEALHGRALALSMLARPEEALACIQQAIPLASHAQRANLKQWATALSAWSKET
ncbi:MAG: hypothetical protein P8R54_00055 [Myxococcota bacterium]|nr:hypothetical protein [Myxococcota bacterium]